MLLTATDMCTWIKQGHTYLVSSRPEPQSKMGDLDLLTSLYVRSLQSGTSESLITSIHAHICFTVMVGSSPLSKDLQFITTSTTVPMCTVHTTTEVEEIRTVPYDGSGGSFL